MDEQLFRRRALRLALHALRHPLAVLSMHQEKELSASVLRLPDLLLFRFLL
jgi:hypothetical protein